MKEKQLDNLGLTNIGEREIVISDMESNNRSIEEIGFENNDLSRLADDEGQDYDGDGDEFYG